MADLEKHFINAVISVLVIAQLPLLEGADTCPTGFQLTSTEEYCYSLKKNPEPLSEKFVNCPGNLFTYEKFMSLGFWFWAGQLWTDYKSLNSGDIFIDWSFTSSAGNVLKTSLELNRSNDVSVDDKLCVVIDPIENLSIVRCDGQHNSYCIVEAKSIGDDDDADELEHVTLTVSVERSDIKLTVGYTTPRSKSNDDDLKLNEADIICYTDSSRYYPSSVEIKSIDLGDTSTYDVYDITALESGKYWCIHTNSKEFYVSESNTVLYIKPDADLKNLYAVKFKTFNSYTLDDIEIAKLLNHVWVKSLTEYVYYSTEYSKLNTRPYDNKILMEFKYKHPDLDYQKKNITNKTLKRLYLDAKTVLLHVELHPDMRPVNPGQWESIHIEYMRPVYYCDQNITFNLGMNYTAPECKLISCVGDYNDGVQSITTSRDGCTDVDTPKDPLDAVVTKLKNLAISTGPIKIDDFYEVFNQPRDLLALIITKLKNNLNSTEPITVEYIEKVINQVDNVLVPEALNITSKFLYLLDDIGAKIDLQGSNVSIVQKNIALLVADTQAVCGFRLAARTSDTFTNDTVSFITDMNSSLLTAAKSELIVSLPNSVSLSKRRVSFLVFRNDHAFQERHEHPSIINSKVISVNVENISKFLPGEVINIHLKPLRKKLKRNQNRTCAFWQFNNDNVTGSWSQEGCIFIQASQAGLLDTCSCDHLTHFAEIFVPRAMFSKIHEVALEKISIIGCCVSILGLLLVILTAVLFRSWRRQFSNKVWLQLCISIMILSFCFLIKVFVQFDEDDSLCPVTGIALHYSVLSSYCWMLVAAVVSYRKLVAVFSLDPTHKLLRVASFAWGAPCAVVIIVLLAAPHSYAGDYEKKSPTGALCYPSGLALWLAVYAPITLMLLSNCTLFVLIVRSVFGPSATRPVNHSQKDGKEAFRCASVSCLLVFLFGLPWFFGLLSSDVVCAYLFTIFVTFQGFMLFFFFVLGNKNTRDLWLIHLKIKQPTSTVMSTKDTNKSMGVNIPLSETKDTRRPLLKKKTPQTAVDS